MFASHNMRLVTWNINGIRSLKADWRDVLASLDADIICLQETKVASKFENYLFIERITSLDLRGFQ